MIKQRHHGEWSTTGRHVTVVGSLSGVNLGIECCPTREEVVDTR